MASEDGVTVPLNVYTGLGDCSGVFGSSPPISDGRLTFVGGTPQHHAACWLARFFGPQAAPTMTARPQHVQLGSAGPVKLVADLVVSGAGQQLVIDGNGNRATVVVGEWQIRVQHGAELHLKRIAVSLSTESSAIVVVKARVLATEASFHDCYTHANAYQLSWAAAGGVFYLANASLELHGSELVANRAEALQRSQNSFGGAIFAAVGSTSTVKLVECLVRLNAARVADEDWMHVATEAAGGGIYVSSSFLALINCTIDENSVWPIWAWRRDICERFGARRWGRPRFERLAWLAELCERRGRFVR
jgi:hypothetical protein